MKLLFTSDPHNRPDDLRLGTLARARGCALVAVAGDLLDVFGKHPGTQIHSAVGWVKALAAAVPHVAVCSGNHDPDGPNGAGWLTGAAAAVRTGNLVVDGSSAVLRGEEEEDNDGLVVSCCPYWNILERGVTHLHWLRNRAENVWREGRRMADLHGLPWVVLHHEPPEGTRIMAGASHLGEDFGAGAFWAAEWCRQYRPDYLLCGHLHQAPFVAGGSWADRVGGSPTWAFNPGRDRAGCRAVEVDPVARVARWFGSWAGETEEVRALDGVDSEDGGTAGNGSAAPVGLGDAAVDDDDQSSAEWEIWRERNRHRPQT